MQKKKKLRSRARKVSVTAKESLQRMAQFGERKEQFVAAIKKSAIEVFLPDCRDPAYRNLLMRLDTEFTHTFGGATTDYGLDGTYLTHAGRAVRERVNVIYTDVPFDSDQHRNELERYTDELRDAIAKTLK